MHLTESDSAFLRSLSVRGHELRRAEIASLKGLIKPALSLHLSFRLGESILLAFTGSTLDFSPDAGTAPREEHIWQKGKEGGKYSQCAYSMQRAAAVYLSTMISLGVRGGHADGLRG